MLPARELGGRRTVLVVAAAAVLALALGAAVAFGLVGGDSTVLDRVPEDADAVVRVDPAILDDPSSRSLLDVTAAAVGLGSISTAESIAAIENRTGLSRSAVDDAVAFGRYGATGDLDVRYAGVVVHANWSGAAVRDALSEQLGVSYEETSIGGYTVYQPAIEDVAAAPSVAVLDDGAFVLGTPLAVDDAVAVADGSADSLGGPVRSSLSAADDGLVTVAATLPRERVAAFDDRTGGLTRLGSVRVVAGTYDTAGGAADDAVALGVHLHTNGTEAAQDVTDVARGGLAVLASDVENETVADTLRSVTVERQGRTVVLSLETSPGDLRTIARYYGFGGA